MNARNKTSSTRCKCLGLAPFPASKSRQHRMIRTFAVTALAALGCCLSVGGATQYIQFEGIPTSDALQVAPWLESGFLFSAPKAPGVVNGGGYLFRDSALIFPNPTPGYFEPPVNGSKYVASFSGSRALFRSADGTPFSLFSLDLAEYSSAGAVHTPITVTGTRAGGTTITNVLTLDGHVDALPDPPDFQTFTFGAGWTNLSQVTFLANAPPFYAAGISFDNFAVELVPEPMLWPALLVFLPCWRHWGVRRQGKAVDTLSS